MVDSIKLLEEERKSLSVVLDTEKVTPLSEVSQVTNCELDPINESVVCLGDGCENVVSNAMESSKSIETLSTKNKILVVGDQTAKNVASLLKTFSNLDYNIQGFIKPSADLLELSKSVFYQSTCFGMNDFVIFMFNTINASNWKTLNNSLRIIKAVGKCTNVIVIPICNQKGDKWIIDRVFNYLSSGRDTSIKIVMHTGHIKRAVVIDIINYISSIQASATKLVLRNVPLLESSRFFRA